MYLEKEENSSLFWFAFCRCDHTVAKRNLGKKEFIRLYKSRSYSIPGVREEFEGGTGCRDGSRDHGRMLLLTCLLFGFCSSALLMQPGPPDGSWNYP